MKAHHLFSQTVAAIILIIALPAPAEVLEGEILAVSGKVGYVNLGKKFGIEEGQELQLLRDGIPIGIVKVTEASEKNCKVELVFGDRGMEVLDRVRTIQEPKPVEQSENKGYHAPLLPQDSTNRPEAKKDEAMLPEEPVANNKGKEDGREIASPKDWRDKIEMGGKTKTELPKLLTAKPFPAFTGIHNSFGEGYMLSPRTIPSREGVSGTLQGRSLNVELQDSTGTSKVTVRGSVIGFSWALPKNQWSYVFWSAESEEPGEYDEEGSILSIKSRLYEKWSPDNLSWDAMLLLLAFREWDAWVGGFNWYAGEDIVAGLLLGRGTHTTEWNVGLGYVSNSENKSSIGASVNIAWIMGPGTVFFVEGVRDFESDILEAAVGIAFDGQQGFGLSLGFGKTFGLPEGIQVTRGLLSLHFYR